MATESVIKEETAEGKMLSKATNAYLSLFQIKAIAEMLNDHPELGEAGFNETISGGILAIQQLAERACDDFERSRH